MREFIKTPFNEFQWCFHCEEYKTLDKFKFNTCLDCGNPVKNHAFIVWKEKHLKKTKARLLSYKNFDLSRGYDNDLTEEWYKDNILNKPCIYCGTYYRIGVDRLDSSKGHIQSNCVPCCRSCNSGKGNRSPEFMLLKKEEIRKETIREEKNQLHNISIDRLHKKWEPAKRKKLARSL